MTDPALPDTETRAAVDALVYRLRNRGDADDEVLAGEFIAALLKRGWCPPGHVADRQRALCDWAAAHTSGRDDWDPVTLLGVMGAAKNAGVPYEAVAPVLWRLAWTGDDHRDFAELRDLARNSVRRPAASAMTREERGRLWRDALENRKTGPQAALSEDNGTPGTGAA